jgi:hypothetical protein
MRNNGAYYDAEWDRVEEFPADFGVALKRDVS